MKLSNKETALKFMQYCIENNFSSWNTIAPISSILHEFMNKLEGDQHHKHMGEISELGAQVVEWVLNNTRIDHFKEFKVLAERVNKLERLVDELSKEKQTLSSIESKPEYITITVSK